jgi:hypothetical protein
MDWILAEQPQHAAVVGEFRRLAGPISEGYRCMIRILDGQGCIERQRSAAQVSDLVGTMQLWLSLNNVGLP